MSLINGCSLNIDQKGMKGIFLIYHRGLGSPLHHRLPTGPPITVTGKVQVDSDRIASYRLPVEIQLSLG